MTDLTELAEFLTSFRFEALPLDVIAAATESFANVAGVAIGGLDEEATRRTLRVTKSLGSAPQSIILGTGARRSMDHAALVQGVAAHVLDFDDTDLATIYHPSCVLHGAIWSMADYLDVDGEAAARAWVVGLEAGLRVASALGMAHYDRGWHVTGTAGVVAAAAGCATLLGSGTREFAQCLNLAATMSAGHRVHFGYDAKSGHAGFAAQQGLTAALLTREGFTSAPTGITGSRGLLGVIGADGPHEALTDGLGSAWRILDNRIKPYASGVVTHPSIDLARLVRERCGVDAGGLASVELFVHPLVGELTGIAEPASGLQGKFSVRHCFAAGYLNDRAGAREFTDASVRDPNVTAVRDLVVVNVDPNMPHMTARASVQLASGSREEFSVDAARGSNGRPMLPDEVRAKFIDVTSGRLSEPAADRWFDRLLNVAEVRSMAEFAASLDQDTSYMTFLKPR
jgi:2-methylcitrate dehydratase PrpD